MKFHILKEILFISLRIYSFNSYLIKNQESIIFPSIQKRQYLFYLKRRKNDYSFDRKFLFDYFILYIYIYISSFFSSLERPNSPTWSNLSSLFLCFSLPRETATRESNGFKNLRRRTSLRYLPTLKRHHDFYSRIK